jgi:hypothetical protein
VMGVKGVYKHSEERLRKITENRVTARGETHGQSVLNDAKVLCLVELSKLGFYSHRQLGTMFGVSRETVTAILNGWTWGHITGIIGSRKQNRPRIV